MKRFLLLLLSFAVLAAVPRAGAQGNALSFNGSNYVNVPGFGNIAPTTAVTVEFWANVNALDTHSAFMLSPDNATNRFNAHISFITGITQWDFGNSTTTGSLSTSTPPNTVGNWVHYALTATQYGMALSVRNSAGQIITSAAKGGSSPSPFVRGIYDLRIGGGPSYFLNGRLEEFRVWNTVRSDAEIEANLNRTLVGNEPGLLLYYRFNEGSGTTAINSATATGAAFNGTLVNNPVRAISTAPIGNADDYTVFGTGERDQLDNAASTGLIKLDRASLYPEPFNYTSQNTHKVSLISSGTLAIDSANNLYATYFDGNRNDIKEMEIMAETLIIRSPLILKGTKVTINARTLRFEGAGKIITTPDIRPLPAANATGPAANQKGGDGDLGLPGGSVEVNAGTYTDATGNGNSKFVLTGGTGQGAGKGAHGVDGTNIPPLGNANGPYTSWYYGNSGTLVFANYGVGCLMTYKENDEDGGSSNLGNPTWPTNGLPAWTAGIPGNGGNGGTLTTSNPNVFGVYSGGHAGTPGYPDPSGVHVRTDLCEGGRAGTPVCALHIHMWTTGFFQDNNHISVGEQRSTTPGANTDVVPVRNQGGDGSRVTAGGNYTWLNPQLLRKILSDAKDDYLQNRIANVQSRLTDYAQVVEQYKADAPSWNAASPMTQSELSQMYDDMRLLLQRIANNLDYFGNPNGWVPMLSFEVLSNVFNQEIDRSLDMVYLSRWITQKQADATETFNALGTARNKLAEEIADAQGKFATGNATLAGLQNDALTLSQRVLTLQLQLEAKDTELHAKAVRNSQPEDWEVALRTSLKVVGTICKMVPVYQPALGEGGDLLNLGSTLDPDEPWATITGGLDLAETSLNSRIKDAAAEQATQISNASLNPAQLKEIDQGTARINKLTAMSTASSSLSSGIKDIRTYLASTKAPSDKVDAELEKLKNSDPEYKPLVTEIEKLMNDRRDFADKIIAAIDDVASNSTLITRGIQAMDGLSTIIGANAAVIDSRINAYLKDMERQAFDRLLKYHYYLSKAYEYRMVTPYTAQLDLTNLYNQMTAIANAQSAGSNGTITDGQRQTLRTVFKQILGATTQKILTDYNASPSVTEVLHKLYALNADQIASLNKGDAIQLNLKEVIPFQPDKENLRIVSLKLTSITTVLAPGEQFGQANELDLIIEHSGVSNLQKDGQVYQYRHYNKDTRNAITWHSVQDPLTQFLFPTTEPPPLASDVSLIGSLVPGLTTGQTILFSRPTLWADLTIWRQGNVGNISFFPGNNRNTTPPLLITAATLDLQYDYSARRTNPAPPKNLEVYVSSLGDGPGATPVADDALLPNFIITPPDLNGRMDEQGRFLRIYPPSAPTVQVTAQSPYGSLGFVRWIENGVLVSTNPTLTVATAIDHRYEAVYRSLAPNPTSSLTATANVGTPFSYQMTTTSTPFNFDATGLPTGLSVNPNNGLISGTPTINGSFNVSLSAGNASGVGAATLVLTVGAALNDNFANAQTLSGASGTVTGGNGGTTRETGEPDLVYTPPNSGAHSVWYRWTAPTTGTATIDTEGSDFDTLLGVYTGSVVNNLFPIASDDDSGAGTASLVTFAAVAGTTYRIAVDGYFGTTGSITLHYSVVSALTALETWRQIYFGSPTNTGNGADTFDFDKDGISNLVEFGFGLNPTQNNGAGQLPRPQKVGGNFVATFTQPIGVSGITYGAEWSFTLAAGSWTAIPDTGAGSTHTFSLPIGTATKLFMRLKVTNP